MLRHKPSYAVINVPWFTQNGLENKKTYIKILADL